MEVALGPVLGPSGPLVVAFHADITERRENERRIRDYQARLQAMAFEAAIAEETERRRIAVDLHDRIGQSLALAQMKVGAARSGPKAAARAALDGAIELLREAAADVRTLTFDLSPPVLYDLGLEAAIAWLAEDVGKRHGVRVETACEAIGMTLESPIAALVFRSVRELVLNVLKHAKTSSARVALARAGDGIDVTVEDRGAGFDPSALDQRAVGFGLFSVREQIARIGGKVEITSAPRAGTTVRIHVPIRDAKT